MKRCWIWIAHCHHISFLPSAFLLYPFLFPYFSFLDIFYHCFLYIYFNFPCFYFLINISIFVIYYTMWHLFIFLDIFHPKKNLKYVCEEQITSMNFFSHNFFLIILLKFAYRYYNIHVPNSFYFLIFLPLFFHNIFKVLFFFFNIFTIVFLKYFQFFLCKEHDINEISFS